jgi:hypothetical protein
MVIRSYAHYTSFTTYQSQPDYTCFDPTAAELVVAVGCYSGVESAVPPMIDVDCLALMPLV